MSHTRTRHVSLSVTDGKSGGKESFLSCFGGDTNQPSPPFTWANHRRMACFCLAVRLLSVLRVSLKHEKGPIAPLVSGIESRARPVGRGPRWCNRNPRVNSLDTGSYAASYQALGCLFIGSMRSRARRERAT